MRNFHFVNNGRPKVPFELRPADGYWIFKKFYATEFKPA